MMTSLDSGGQGSRSQPADKVTTASTSTLKHWIFCAVY